MVAHDRMQSRKETLGVILKNESGAVKMGKQGHVYKSEGVTAILCDTSET